MGTLRAKPSSDSVEDFRNLQMKLRQKELSLKNKWRVTDLVTIGSPLAHAALLLAGKQKRSRGTPTKARATDMSPIPDDGEYGYDPAP